LEEALDLSFDRLLMMMMIVINSYNIRIITIKMYELLLVSYTINRVKIITIKMCIVISTIYY